MFIKKPYQKTAFSARTLRGPIVPFPLNTGLTPLKVPFLWMEGIGYCGEPVHISPHVEGLRKRTNALRKLHRKTKER